LFAPVMFIVWDVCAGRVGWGEENCAHSKLSVIKLSGRHLLASWLIRHPTQWQLDSRHHRATSSFQRPRQERGSTHAVAC